MNYTRNIVSLIIDLIMDCLINGIIGDIKNGPALRGRAVVNA